MAVHAFTSFTYSYLNRARVLAQTLKAHHPDWKLWAIVTDKPSDSFNVEWSPLEFDRVIEVEDLYGDETEQWLFGMDVVEACTAVKGRAAEYILSSEDCDKLIYLDPDIAIFNKMDIIVEELDRYSIVLTPHQVTPEQRSEVGAIRDNEIASLVYGVFNLGFVAVRNDAEGRRFVRWWEERLHDWCYDRTDIGVFVDQKWCNLVPCFFDGVRILRDFGCNVASWNLSQRKIRFDNDGYAYVNGALLRFFHFTKLGDIGDIMTQRYAKDNIEVYEIWLWYKMAVLKCTDLNIPRNYWHYRSFDNGVEIPKAARELYRERDDLRKAFAKPRNVEDGYYKWLRAETECIIG